MTSEEPGGGAMPPSEFPLLALNPTPEHYVGDARPEQYFTANDHAQIWVTPDGHFGKLMEDAPASAIIASLYLANYANPKSRVRWH